MAFRNSSFRLTTALFVLLTLMLALSACTLAGDPVPAGPIETGPLPGETSRLVPAEAPNLANGAQIFALHCVKCHGASGKGDGESVAILTQQGATLPDFSKPSFGRSRDAQDLFRVITVGNIERLMPPWESSLSDAERWDVAAYVAALSVTNADLDKGKAVYAANCESCHGADGSQNKLNDLAAMSTLAPQDLFDRYTGVGTDGIHQFSALDDESRWAVTHYARSLTTRFDPQAVAELPSPTPTISPEIGATPGATGEATQPTDATPGATPEAVTSALGALGAVRGSVINGTSGGASTSGMEIQLKGLTLDDTGQIIEFMTKTGAVEADGSYSFADLPFDRQQSAYAVSVIYNGVEFANAELIDPSKPEMDLQVTVYETATDPSVLSVASHHLILQQHPDALLVNEVMILSNASDRVFVSPEPVAGGRKGSVAIVIPADAYGLAFEGGELGGRFAQVGDTIYDTQQILPGDQSHTITLSYILPFSAARDMTIDVSYPTAQLNVLAEEGLDVSSAQLTNMGAADVPGQTTYTRYNAQNLTVGQPVTIRASKPIQINDALRIGLSALLAALVIGSGALWLARRRAGPAKSASVAIRPDLDEGLVKQIAALDDDFAAGKINRFDYEARRAELKAALAEKMEEE